MRRIQILLPLAALAAISMAYDATADFKKFIQGTIPKVQKAFESEDSTFLRKSSTDDFSQTENGRKNNKKDSFAGLDQFFQMASGIKMKYTLMSCSAKGKSGKASMHSVMNCMVTPPGGKAAKWEMEMWEDQTWVMVGKQWKLKSITEAKPMKLKIDGKSMDPAKVMGGGAG